MRETESTSVSSSPQRSLMGSPAPNHGATVGSPQIRSHGPSRGLMDLWGGKKVEGKLEKRRGKSSTPVVRPEICPIPIPPRRVGTGMGQWRPRVVP